MNPPRTLAAGLLTFFLIAAAALAVTETWDGGGADFNLNTNANWLDNTAPLSDLANTDLIFAGAVRLTPNVSAALSVRSITFANAAGAFSIGGGITPIAIGTGGIINSGTATQQLACRTDFSNVADSVINAAAGPLRFTGNVQTTPTGTLTVTGAFDTEFSNILRNPPSAGILVKQGAGTMTWMPNLTQELVVTVNGGTLRFGPDGSTNVFNLNGGFAINGTSVLDLDENLTLDGASLTRATGATISIATGKTLRVQNGGDVTITGGHFHTTASTIAVSTNGTFSTTESLIISAAFDGARLDIASGGDVSAGFFADIGSTFGDGTVTVDGSGSSFNASSARVGRFGSNGRLTFSNASTGTITVLRVGEATLAGTDGSIEILSGSSVTSTTLQIAPSVGATTGLVRINGAGSMLTINGTTTDATIIGATSSSAGTLSIQAGGTFRSGTGTATINPTGSIVITGGTCSAAGHLTLHGGSLTRDGSGVLAVGAGKTFTVQNGGSAALTGFTIFNGFDSVVTGGSSMLRTVTGSFSFQNGATLNVTAGGEVAAQALSLNFGNAVGAPVFAVVDGAGSSISGATGAFWGILGGTADVTFRNSAAGSFPGGMQIAHTTTAGSSAAVNLESGADITSGNLALAGQVGAGVTGTIAITGTGSSWTQSSPSLLTIGAASGSSGLLNVNAGATFTTGTAATTLNATGAIAIAAGTFNANGNVTLNGGQLTRDAAGAFLLAPSRAFTVQAGGDATFTGAFTGSAAQDITVTGAGSTLTTLGGGALQIRGGASLDVLAGGAVMSAGALNVGTGIGAGDGTVLVSSAGASLSVAGQTSLGLNGNSGSLTFFGGTGTFADLNVGVSGITGTNGQLIMSGSPATPAAVTATGLGIGAGTGVSTGAASLGATSSLTILGSGATTIGAASNAIGTLDIQGAAIFSSGTGSTTVKQTGTVAIGGVARFLSNGPLVIDGGLLTRGTSGTLALATGTTMTVQNGGTAIITGGYAPGTAAGTINVTGAGSLFSTTGDLGVYSGAGFNVTAGGDVTTNGGGLFVDGDGFFTVDGTGSSLTALRLEVSNAFGASTVAFSNQSTGAFGGGLSLAQASGGGRQGALLIQSGADVTASGLALASLTASNSGVVTITGAGSTLTLTSVVGQSIIGNASLGTAAVNLQSSGLLQVDNPTTTVRARGRITIESGTYLSNGDLIVDGGQLTRDAAGTFTLGSGKSLTVQNGGDVLFTGNYTAASTTAIAVSGAGSTFSASGTLALSGGATIQATAGGDLVGGTVNIGNAAGGGAVTINGAGSTFNATSVAVGQNGHTGTLTFDNGSTGTFTTINVDLSGFAGTNGTLTIQGGADVTGTNLNVATGANANTGIVIVTGAGSTLMLNGGVTIGAGSVTSGTVTVQSGALLTTGSSAVNVALTGALDVQAGATLRGAADYAGVGPITLAGAFHPGTTSGGDRTTSVSFAQNIPLQPTSSFTMELGGTVPGTSHDQVVFNGPGTPHISWNGALNVVTIDGFIPQAGHSFDLFDFDAARDAGAFSSINLPVLGAGRFWRTEQLYVDGTIAVSSTPGTYAEWQSHYGTGAWADDDDGDGLKNGIEFLLGTDPTVPHGAGLYPIEELPRLGLLARVTFDIPQLPPGDAQYAVQSSPDLVTWTTIATKTGAGPWIPIAGVTVTSDPPVAGFVNTIVSETLPAATTRRNHRLVGTQP